MQTKSVTSIVDNITASVAYGKKIKKGAEDSLKEKQDKELADSEEKFIAWLDSIQNMLADKLIASEDGSYTYCLSDSKFPTVLLCRMFDGNSHFHYLLDKFFTKDSKISAYSYVDNSYIYIKFTFKD